MEGRRDEGAGQGRRDEGAGNGRVAHHDSSGARDEAMRRGYARARERDDAARAALVPLAPGERPRAVTVSALLAAVIALANIVLILAGQEVDGERPVVGGLVFSGVMAVAAIGMWQVRYWAVLGFQVLLGVSLVFALLGLLRASNLAAVLTGLAVLAVAGPLFWLLIRAMARIQMPRRPLRQETPDQDVY
jgi:hypothetical protein